MHLCDVKEKENNSKNVQDHSKHISASYDSIKKKHCLTFKYLLPDILVKRSILKSETSLHVTQATTQKLILKANEDYLRLKLKFIHVNPVLIK